MIDDTEYEMLLCEARLVAGQIVKDPHRFTHTACFILCWGTEIADQIARERGAYISSKNGNGQTRKRETQPRETILASESQTTLANVCPKSR